VFTDGYILNCITIGVNWNSFAKGGEEERLRNIPKKTKTTVNVYNIQAS